MYDKLVVKFGFPYSPTACLRPHNLVHVPTPAYAPKGNAYIHNDQCQPPDKSFCLSKNLCSSRGENKKSLKPPPRLWSVAGQFIPICGNTHFLNLN